MAINKTNENKYLLDVYLYQAGKRARVRKIFDTRLEAKNLEADIVKSNREKSNRVVVNKETRTVNELRNYYFTLPRFSVLRKGSKVRNAKLTLHFVDWCKTQGIQFAHEVTKERANQYCSYISQRWNGKGRQHVFIAAKMLFKEELERDNPCITKNPFMKSPFKAKFYKPIAITDEVYRQLCEHMSALERAIYDILYNTGCRSGELLFLCWEQVDSDCVRFEAHKIFDKKQGKYIDWETKNERSRTLPLNTSCRKAFEYLREVNGNNEFVLPDECRDIPHWLTRRFEKIKRSTIATYPFLKTYLFSRNRDKNITPKTLRSTFITNIALASGNPLIAQLFAGHTNISTTQKHYTDFSRINMTEAINKLDDRISS